MYRDVMNQDAMPKTAKPSTRKENVTGPGAKQSGLKMLCALGRRGLAAMLVAAVMLTTAACGSKAPAAGTNATETTVAVTSAAATGDATDAGATAQSEGAQAAGTAAAAEAAQATVWEIPYAGMDIALPDSWASSGLYVDYQVGPIADGAWVTEVFALACTREELEQKAEELGGSSAEFQQYAAERICDLFAILSIDDRLGAKGLLELLGRSESELPMRRIGQAEGWTFYELQMSEEQSRRPAVTGQPEYDAAIDKILEDRAKVFDKIRFYAPLEQPGLSPGNVLSFETVDTEGNPVSSSELFAGNKFTMVNIWASWCGPCRAEFPELAKLSGEFAEQGCGLISVLMDGNEEQGLADGRAVIEQSGAAFPNLVPTPAMQEQLSTRVVPTTIFVDPEGVIVGEMIEGANIAAYREVMQKLLESGQ